LSSLSVKKPNLTRVLEFSIDPTHMTAIDGALFCCIDPRYWNPIGENTKSTVQAFVEMKGWKFVPLTEAGGIKVLASDNPYDAAERESALRRIEQEVGLHHPKVVALSAHWDCGGYGYSKAFGNDPEQESDRLSADFLKAKEAVAARIGSAAIIELYLFDERGVQLVSFD